MCDCKCLNKTVVSIIVIILIVVTFIFHIIAVATNFWLKSSSATQENFLNIGLFQACFDNYLHPHEDGGTPVVYDGCHHLESEYYATIRDWLVPGWIIMSRIMVLIAFILLIVGLLLFLIIVIWFVCQWVSAAKSAVCATIIVYAAPIIFILAGIFMMMAIMIWADNAFRLQCKDFWLGGDDPFNNHLSFSWVFELIAMLCSFVTGGFLIWLAVLEARQ